MSDTDPKALRALCREAQDAAPEPWESAGDYPIVEVTCASGLPVAECSAVIARYIAAVSPATVLALLDRLEAAERDAKFYEEQVLVEVEVGSRFRERAETAERELAEARAWGKGMADLASHNQSELDTVRRERDEARAALAEERTMLRVARIGDEDDLARLRRIEEAARVCLENYDDVADSEGADIKALRAALKEGRDG